MQFLYMTFDGRVRESLESATNKHANWSSALVMAVSACASPVTAISAAALVEKKLARNAFKFFVR